MAATNSITHDWHKCLPKQDRDFLEVLSKAPVWMPGDVREYHSLIVPDPLIRNEASYQGPDGQWQRELLVTQASNAIAVNYFDPRNGKRPGERGFVVADGKPSSKPSLHEAFQLDHDEFKRQAQTWLSNVELRIIPSQIAWNPTTGSIADVAFIAPKGLEWAKLAWDLIHGSSDVARLNDSYNPKIIFYAVPGLRDMFGGEQCTMFERCDGGVIRIYTNSSYMGLAMSKKPIFVALSHLLQESGGLMCHATMAILDGSGHRRGYIYHAASGHGKTEFRYVREGSISLGVLEDGRHITLWYPPDVRPSIICAGDDGVMIPDFKGANGYGRGQNSERGGLFDRPSAARHRGDLPENDLLLEQGADDPFCQLLLNMAASPGKVLETHQRELDTQGNLHSNPRHTYTWKALGELQLLRDQRVSFTTEPVTFGTSIFGMGVTSETAVASWINRLPLCSAYTMMLAGVCQSKSVSVTDSGVSATHGLKLDRFGTMESFTINEAVDNANRLWEYYKNFHRVEHYAIPIGHVGPNISAKDNEAELLAREFLFQMEVGNAATEWFPHLCPFFGMSPKNARFFGQSIPATYSDPSMQFETRTKFKDACDKVLTLMRDGLADILAHPRLNAEAKRAIELAFAVPLYVDSAAERARIFDMLNRVPWVA